MTPTLALMISCSLPIGLDSDAKPVVPAKLQTATPAASNKQETAEPTLADKIGRLQSNIADAEKQLKLLKSQLKDPNSEYEQASKEFRSLEENIEQTKKKIEELTKEGKKEEAAKLQDEFKSLNEKHQLSKDRFNLAIKERQMLQEKVKAMSERNHQDQIALDELLGKNSASGDKKKGAKEEKKKVVPAPPAQVTPPAASPTEGSSAVLQPGQVQAGNSTNPSPPISLLPKAPPDTKELKDARKNAEVKKDAVEKAKSKATSLAKRLEVLAKNIKLDKSLLQTATQQVEHLKKELAQLEKERQQLVDEKKLVEAAELENKIDQAKGRLQKAQKEVQDLQSGVQKMNQEQGELRREQEQALQEVQKKRSEAERAQQRVSDLQNPFTLKNLIHWWLENGPSLAAIIIGIMALRFLTRIVSRQIVKMISRGGRRFSIREAESRGETLAGIFRSVASMLIYGGGTLMILDVIGLPIVPLLGGVAILGLAVAFGTQNLIRDYFTGFMILMEDQYGMNDVVKIGDITARVERITLRMTVLRDLSGVAHFIPHGTITTVSNLTHGHSVAVFDIGVAYKEKPDEVMEVLVELGKELRQHSDYGPLILEDPVMLGVDNFGDSAVTIKFYLKTKPLKQWVIKREMLRRIKNKFDELGIEIPFPHRTVYHRHETEIPAGENEGKEAEATRWVA